MLSNIKQKVSTILTFGDSNTWGYVPGKGERYPQGVRWTSIVQERAGYEKVRIIENGLNGRTAGYDDIVRPSRNSTKELPAILESQLPLDAVTIMLGTNDCKTHYNSTPEIIGENIRILVHQVKKLCPNAKILLISTVSLGKEITMPDMDPEFDERSVFVSWHIRPYLEKVAEEENIEFLAADDYAAVSSVDCEHMDENGHAALAKAVFNKLLEMKVI